MKRIATGIYRTPKGFRAYVRVAQGLGGLRSQRFPATAKLSAMKAWREDQRVDARKKPYAVVMRGTLAEDIETYLSQVRSMPTYDWRRRDLYTWREVFGDLSRSSITSGMIREQLQTWRTVGPRRVFLPREKVYRDVRGALSASACNHRRTALLHLYTLLDGKESPNPVKSVATFSEPAPEPRARDLVFLVAAIARMKNEAQRTRARVLLWTGMRGNSELGRMRPEHVNIEAQVCHVPTGKGGRRFRTVPLNANGVEAWRDFTRMNLWGPYDKNLLLKSFRRACRSESKAQGIDVARTRIYDLRHSISVAYLKSGADLADVQELLGHTTGRMTRRYAPFTPEKLHAVGRTLETAEPVPVASARSLDLTNLTAKVIERFWRKTTKGTGCWLWTGAVKDTGYGMIKIAGRTLSAPRIAYALTHGKDPGGRMVCHHCDQPACVNPDHLFLGSSADNSNDAVRKGRLLNKVPGKLTPEERDAASQQFLGGLPAGRVASAFGISRTGVEHLAKARIRATKLDRKARQ